MGSNRKDLLRECLIELNLEFDISFSFYIHYFVFFASLQVVTYNQNDSIKFVSLEELKSPTVVRGMGGEKALEW